MIAGCPVGLGSALHHSKEPQAHALFCFGVPTRAEVDVVARRPGCTNLDDTDLSMDVDVLVGVRQVWW